MNPHINIKKNDWDNRTCKQTEEIRKAVRLMGKDRLQFRIHYAWIICITCQLTMIVNMGFNGNLYATYLPFIERQGYTGTQGSMIITIRSVSGMICTIFMGLFYRKFGLRFGVALTTLLGAVSMLLMSRAESIGIYYAAAAISGFPFALGATVAVSMLVNNWFDKHRGVAFGIASAGSGVASCVLPPVVERFIRLKGLSETFICICAIQVLSAVLLFLLLRSKPEDMGMQSYGADENGEKNKVVKTGLNTDEAKCCDIVEETCRIGEERKNILQHAVPPGSSLVAMLLMFFLAGGAHSAATAHISVLGEATGYSSITAARMFSLYGFVMTVTKLGFGEVADRIGALKAGVISLLMYVFTFVPVLFMDGTGLTVCFLASTMIGIGSGGFAMGLSMWTSDFTDKENYSRLLGKFQLGNMAGSMVLSVMPGIIADATGSYKNAYLLLSILFAAALVLLIYAYRRMRQSRKAEAGS